MAEKRLVARPDPVLAGSPIRIVVQVLAAATCYYLSTRFAWLLCFPDSKVSLFFPPHAILVSILLLVPTRHWWAYVLASIGAHFFATQQDGWPTVYALNCEAFDAASVILTAAGIRFFIKSPFHLLSLRDAIVFVVFAVVAVPFGTAFWGAAFTVSFGFGADYWIEWRNLGISNGVTTIVLVPVILIGVQLFREGFKITAAQLLEAGILAAGLLLVSWLAFDRSPAGPNTSPALLYAPIPLLMWAALRFGLGGTCASVLVITMLSIWGTMQGRGPFLTQTPAENALALQLFILMAATPVILLAVAARRRHCASVRSA
jgi:two-component system, LuxR family, sensor kinase FixL